MKDYVTPWTESYSWTYFGIPVVQPTFDRGTVSETHYHTQFDQRDILDLDKSAEAVRLYGSLLVRLDREPVPPYDFVTRAEAMRASVDWPVARALGLEGELVTALDRFEEAARQLAERVERLSTRRWQALSDQRAAVDDLNQRLRAAARYLLVNSSYLGGDFSHEVMYRHVSSQRHLATLDGALAALEAGDAQRALEILTDKEGGLPGAFFGRHVSYPTYHHFTAGAVSPGRPNLLWGKERALPYLDCWMVLHVLQDKLAHAGRPVGTADFGAEINFLRAQREEVVDRLRGDLAHLAQTAATASAMLPVASLQEIEAAS
jgi:hypothetical protein